MRDASKLATVQKIRPQSYLIEKIVENYEISLRKSCHNPSSARLKRAASKLAAATIKACKTWSCKK